MEILQLNLFGEEPTEIKVKEPEPYHKQPNDLKDITRIRILDYCYKKLFFLLKPKFNEKQRGIFIFYHDELQAEIKGTGDLPIRDRIILHIEAIKKIRGKYGN